MSGKRRAAATTVVIGLLASMLVAGCAGPGDSPGRSRAAGTGIRADAQVLGDVAEWAFPLPDSASQARARRIANFTDNLGYQVCGSTPAPLDYVADTAGNQYPDLDLIRERGLAPIYDPVKYYHLEQPYGDDRSPECEAIDRAENQCQSRVMDALNNGAKNAQARREQEECLSARRKIDPFQFSAVYQNAIKAAIAWQEDTMLTVANTEAVLAAGKPMAQCLREGSGLHVTDDNPSDSFLGAVDVAYFSVGSTVTKETMWEWSRLYADCAAPYFEAVKRELLKLRPGLVERHREALEAFAAKLVDLGYVP